MPGALDGIRILDFTRYQQGPFATVMLSDLGAEVIKVEEPQHGDVGRALGLEADGWCAYFEAHNRNKQSVTIDLRTKAGHEVVLRLVETADVVTDNFRPGVMKRLGLDYEALSAVNPRIITASASGFGPTGPMFDWPSFDIIGQGMSGIMSNQGGGPGNPPNSLMGGLADQVGAMVFATGICAAVIARERQGVGQHVDVSLLGSQIALQGVQLTGFLRHNFQGPTEQRRSPTFTYFPCADGKYLTIGILDPKWWPGLCRAIERPDLVEDARFETALLRHQNRVELVAELDAAFMCKTRDTWLPILKAADVPSGPVNDYADVAAHPQILANEYLTTLEHPALGPVGVVGSPIKLSKTPARPQHTAPELGEHTDSVLRSVGYTEDQIADLRAQGAV